MCRPTLLLQQAAAAASCSSCTADPVIPPAASSVQAAQKTSLRQVAHNASLRNAAAAPCPCRHDDGHQATQAPNGCVVQGATWYPYIHTHSIAACCYITMHLQVAQLCCKCRNIHCSPWCELLNVVDVLHALHKLVHLVPVHAGIHVCHLALLLDELALGQQLGSLVILVHDLLEQQLALIRLQAEVSSRPNAEGQKCASTSHQQARTLQLHTSSTTPDIT